jgi:hypothetical protein
MGGWTGGWFTWVTLIEAAALLLREPSEAVKVTE